MLISAGLVTGTSTRTVEHATAISSKADRQTRRIMKGPHPVPPPAQVGTMGRVSTAPVGSARAGKTQSGSSAESPRAEREELHPKRDPTDVSLHCIGAIEVQRRRAPVTSRRVRSAPPR